MTETLQLAIVTGITAGLPATLLALATLVSSIRAKRNTDEIKGKAEEIKVLADGTLTAVRHELAVERERSLGLEKLLAAQVVAAMPREIPGPQGATGETGATGATGEKGEPGLKGRGSA